MEKYIKIKNPLRYGLLDDKIITMADAIPLEAYTCPFCNHQIRYIEEYSRRDGVVVQGHFTHISTIEAGKCTEMEKSGKIISQNYAEEEDISGKFKYISDYEEDDKLYHIVLRDDRKFFLFKATESLTKKINLVKLKEFEIVQNKFKDKDENEIKYWKFKTVR